MDVGRLAIVSSCDLRTHENHQKYKVDRGEIVAHTVHDPILATFIEG